MKAPQIKFDHKDISRVLFRAYAPRVEVYPFWKSSVEHLARIPLIVQLSSTVMEDTSIKTHRKLARSIISICNTPVTPEDFLTYFTAATTPMVNLIFLRVVEPYLKWKKYFTTNVMEFVKSSESKFQWEIAQSIGIDAVIDKPFSFEQRIWIAYASSVSRNDERKFMIDITDNLKPWINNELYQHVAHLRENKKTNVAFESQKKQMFEGSFGVPTTDAPILRKLEQQQEEKSAVSQEDEFDIIR
jgi:hypothetical protein